MDKKPYFLRDLKKSTFSLNFDIFGDICSKRLLQSDLKKKRRFPRNFDIFGYMGIKRFFQSDLKITIFFKMFQKKRIFSTNVDIFRDVLKNYFFKVILLS